MYQIVDWRTGPNHRMYIIIINVHRSNRKRGGNTILLMVC